MQSGKRALTRYAGGGASVMRELGFLLSSGRRHGLHLTVRSPILRAVGVAPQSPCNQQYIYVLNNLLMRVGAAQ